MKRKRTSDDLQACDLVLTDATGRSVRAHRALLIDKSEYFARLLSEHNLSELQLNENYLVELIYYLYSRESDYINLDLRQLSSPCRKVDQLRPEIEGADSNQSDDGQVVAGGTLSQDEPNQAVVSPIDTSLISGDLEILMHLLVLAKKYSFKQLYEILLSEINYKLGPKTAISVYKCASDLNLNTFRDQTRMIILSWLPQIQTREDFLNLSREAIYDIFNAEDADVECNSKLDALSAWWSRNKNVDLTDLWVKLMMSNEKGR